MKKLVQAAGQAALALLVTAASLHAQDSGWNPLAFPDAATPVAPEPPALALPPAARVWPAQGEYPQRPANGTGPASPAMPTGPAGPVRPTGPVYPVPPHRPAAPELIQAHQAYQIYWNEVHAPYPDPNRVRVALDAYNRAMARVPRNNLFGFGFGSGGSAPAAGTNNFPPPVTGDGNGTFPGAPADDPQGLLPGQRKRVVLKRTSKDAYEVFTGEGGQAKLACYVAKPFLAGWGYKARYNVKESVTNVEQNKAWYAITSRDPKWTFFRPAPGQSGANQLLFEFRPQGTGADVYNLSGQLFAKIRWEKRTERGQDVIQRVYYHHLEGRDSAAASSISTRINQAPAVSLRKGAGESAVGRLDLVLQDWAAAPPTGGSSLDFDGLVGGPSTSGGASADELKGLAAFLDAIAIDSAIDAVGWRDATGVLNGFNFYGNE